MLNNRLTYLAVLAVSLVFFCGPVQARTITISTGNYIPWTGENLEDSGPYLRVTREVFNRAGYSVKFKFYPWKRSLMMAEKGQFDASAFWAFSAMRTENFYQSQSLARSKIVFFYRKENPLKEWNDLTDLKEYRIGVTRGYTYTDTFWEKAEEGVFDIDRANDDLNNFRKLIHGRIDLLPLEKIRGYTLLDKHFSDTVASRVSHSQPPLNNTTNHIIFPKIREDSPELLKKFNEQLKKLKAEDDYDRYWEELRTRKGE